MPVLSKISYSRSYFFIKTWHWKGRCRILSRFVYSPFCTNLLKLRLWNINTLGACLSCNPRDASHDKCAFQRKWPPAMKMTSLSSTHYHYQSCYPVELFTCPFDHYDLPTAAGKLPEIYMYSCAEYLDIQAALDNKILHQVTSANK